MSDPEPSLLHRAFAESYVVAAQASPAAECVERDGWLLSDTGTGIDAINHAVALRDAAGELSLEEPGAWFKSRGTGYRVVLRDPANARLLVDATHAGYVVERHQSVMWRDLPVESRPDAAEIVEVADPRQVDAYLGVRDDQPAGHPADDIERAFILAAVAAGQFCYFVGLDDGQAVATASSFVADDVTIVSNVFVRSSHRKRGLGAAMTAVAANSSTGARLVMLEASAMGAPLYSRIGFELAYYHVRLAPPG